MRTAPVLVIALMLLPWCASGAPPPEQQVEQKRDSDAGGAKADYDPRNVDPILEQGIEAEGTANKTEHESQECSCKAAESEWTPTTVAQLVFAALVTAFTGGLLYTSKKQWGAIRESNRISRRNLHLSHRPWVITDNMQVESASTVGTPEQMQILVKFSVDLINCGNTPALRVRAKVGWCLLDKTEPEPANPPYVPERVLNFATGIIGKQPMKYVDWIGEGTNMPVESLFLTKHFYLYGCIQYEGSFGRRKPYVTKFCYRKDAYAQNSFTMIGPYNDAC